ncbi:ATP phosphoribosyltransferase [Mongoliimonas terrestris]|uniref:ATP phosphoribosyltransferase n=1 Tax=Mongoliimonas terrestris TaxID=1709001 RepID=UPI000949731C|nr:ATP phosphoribosyltransferase [Mongoliimonas terrestris]
MTGPLVVAVPSKGRLQEQTLAFFDRSGLPVRQARGARDYFARISGLPDATISFRSASEIAREVGAGSVHLAVTGMDLLHETLGGAQDEIRPGVSLDETAPPPAHVVTRLGFGHANVVVAVPQAWLDVVTMSDLADVAARFRLKHHRPMRVATKYVSLTRRFLTGHGVHDYLIVESPGATEGAPAAGSAELIVDITSTGQTLVENGLKVVDDGVIMRSEAALVASLEAGWSDKVRTAARTMLTRIAADARARSVKMIEAAVTPSVSLFEAARIRFGATAPFTGGNGTGGGPAIFLCPTKTVHGCAAWLLETGATTVSVRTVDYVFEAENQLWLDLARRL